MLTSNVPILNRTEIDGVPVVWSSAPGPLTAALVFRVGRADERASESGITHLVEHLAMAPLGQPRYDHNAFVEGNRTVFYAGGSQDEVTDFLAKISAALRDLPLDRLEMERDVLRREGDGSGDSISELHRHIRFGLNGHGMVGRPEFGMGSLEPSRIDGWARHVFSRGNAALWLTGEPPASLRLHLGDGQRLTPPVPMHLKDLALPAYLAEGVDGFAVGLQLPRRLGAGTFTSVLHRRLRRQLRLERGLVYEVMTNYEPLDANWALSFVGTDCAPEQAATVADVAFGELESLIAGEVTDEELADELTDTERALADATAVAGLLDVTSTDELLGMQPRTAEERYEEQRRTSAADVAARAAEAHASMILMSNSDRRPVDFVPYPMSSLDRIAGREVRPLLSLMGLGRRQRLIIGPDGVTYTASDGILTTIRFADVVLLERVADDEIVLWSKDGDRIYLPAVFWRRGKALLAEIFAAVPSDVVIDDLLSPDLIPDENQVVLMD